MNGNFTVSSLQPRPENRLLLALPATDWAQMRCHFRERQLSGRGVLLEQGQHITQTYWPHTAVVSTIVRFKNGSFSEVAMTGLHGMAPVEAILGYEVAEYTRIVQVPGTVLRLPYDKFKQAQREIPAFANVLTEFLRAYMRQAIQNGACNAAHSVASRTARLLLSLAAASGKDEMPVTQEFLAGLLSVSREAAGGETRKLQRAGLIKYHRGILTIEDREGLEAVACECYRIIRDGCNASIANSSRLKGAM